MGYLVNGQVNVCAGQVRRKPKANNGRARYKAVQVAVIGICVSTKCLYFCRYYYHILSVCSSVLKVVLTRRCLSICVFPLNISDTTFERGRAYKSNGKINNQIVTCVGRLSCLFYNIGYSQTTTLK